jgi:RNA 3'-terminal phosphate cyclase
MRATLRCTGKLQTATSQIVQSPEPCRSSWPAPCAPGIQLLLPLALAGGGSFTAEKLNLHARTNIDVIANFLSAEFEVKQENEGVRIEVRMSK